MLQGNALRHQILLPEQQAIYDYWRSKCRGQILPSRDDIQAIELADYLPAISLIELCSDNHECQYKYRLAGTQFYDIYKRELTGQYINELPQGSRRDYWMRILNRVVKRRKPSAGVVRSALSGKTHMAQFWIRLPLISGDNNQSNVRMILGFDKFIPLSDLSLQPEASEKIYA